MEGIMFKDFRLISDYGSEWFLKRLRRHRDDRQREGTTFNAIDEGKAGENSGFLEDTWETGV
ncbi:MAG: hypothetical protein PWQ77_1668 [Kosmotogales bacterium]|nr:hypothetical protein [Kosmotogales bacterium]